LGNLCGLLGVFVVGPLSSFITVSVVSWLTALFPSFNEAHRAIGVILSFVAMDIIHANNFRGLFFRNVAQQIFFTSTGSNPAISTICTANAPVIEAQMRELPVLRTSVWTRSSDDQAIVGADPQKPTVPIIKQLSDDDDYIQARAKGNAHRCNRPNPRHGNSAGAPATINISLGQR